MKYFQQLQEKYPDDIQKAYKEYIVSKTIYRTFYVSEDTNLFVKKAMELQTTLNKYAQAIINNEKKTLANVLGLDKNKRLGDFFMDKEEIFTFLEIDRESLINHLTGNYEIQLKKSIPQNLQWSDLESIIKEESNNSPVLDENTAQERLKHIVKTFGLNSVSYGKVRTTENAINKLENGLTQLQQVLDCHPQQVGMKKYNIFLDVSEFIYAGKATEVQENIKLYINERLSYDAFAHEWLHGMDILQAKVKDKKFHMYSKAKKGSINKLLNSLNEQFPEDIAKIKSTIINDTKIYMDKIVDRFNLMTSVDKPKKLKKKLQEEICKIEKGSFDFDSIKYMIYDHMKDVNGCPSYILTELSMLNKFLKNKDKNFKSSYFYEYAKEMQKILEKTGLIKEQYSTLEEERFARAFESFVQVKLEKKGLTNDIAHANVSSWTPKAIETIRQESLWNDVLKEIKEVMEVYLPTKNQPLDNEYVKSNIMNIRKKTLQKEEQKIAVKIK